ncbi:MAG: Glyceraldehyde-3-phosphate dehydrogenase, type I [Microgenomates group bacterium GW2011_GWF2_47_9]|nr:MAG: Glyceraldehyde-3-phosphate dehydrogenase, type I [Microgenomates group bacterium GW2011_GWF2_47_9]
MKHLAINGFGRIGRLAARVWHQFHTDQAVIAAINTSGSLDLAGWAHLLKYDTAYRAFLGTISFEEHQKASTASVKDPFLGNLIIDNKYKIPVLAERDPSLIPWSRYGAEIIIESTGVFTTLDLASKHLDGGAKKVVISAPGKGGGIPTSVLGVNAASIDNSASVINNASCTTNCVAPVAAIIEGGLGIKKAGMTTIHSFTDDQNTQDGSHRDLRRARAASYNIVPTSTGAAIATTETIPALKGLFDGIALRVPTLTGSLTDFTFLVKKNTSKEEVNNLFTEASKLPRWQGILAVTSEPIVSSDVVGRRESALVDLSLTQVIDGDLVKVFAWYDNEWGYANRLVETAISLASA